MQVEGEEELDSEARERRALERIKSEMSMKGLEVGVQTESVLIYDNHDSQRDSEDYPLRLPLGIPNDVNNRAADMSKLRISQHSILNAATDNAPTTNHHVSRHANLKR